MVFAIPSWLSIMLGLQQHHYIVASIGFGIALYGLAISLYMKSLFSNVLDGFLEAITNINGN